MVVGISQQEIESLNDIDIDKLELDDLKSDILIDLYCDSNNGRKKAFLIDLKPRAKGLEFPNKTLTDYSKAMRLTIGKH